MLKRRRQRVRIHLLEDGLPSIEGLLVGKGREYQVAVAQLITSADAHPSVLESKLTVVPRDRIVFYEVL